MAHQVGVDPPGIVSPKDQRVSFVELFFDLIFVFCVTQVVQLVHGGYSVGALLRAGIVFWLVWWSWTQFTWTLNAADTRHHKIELGTLSATAVAFFMAVAIPGAFGGKALWFAGAYVVVRLIGLIMQRWVAEAASARQHAAARRFMLASLGGLGAVLVGGYVGGSAQYWLWGGAMALDVGAALLGGRSGDWNLHAEPFAERHGLFVIITLGETLIVAAGVVSDALWTPAVLGFATLAVASTGALWWVYFVRAKPRLDHALEQSSGAKRSALARDVFSLMHFPILLGLIPFATAIEAGLSRPGDPFSLSVRLGLAVGMALYLGGMAICVLRATARVLWARIALTVLLGALLVLVPGSSPVLSFGILALGISAVAASEQGMRAART